VSTDLLYRWKRGTQVGSGGTRAVGEGSGADDLRALQRENAQLRMENDILKKAAIILGTKSPHNSAK
jgi:transposase-like protein